MAVSPARLPHLPMGTLRSAGTKFIAAALALCPGCAPSLDPWVPSDHVDGPWVELGTGDAQWLPIEDGDTLAVERGSQGGTHIYGALRSGGLDGGSVDDVAAWTAQDRPTITFSLSSDAGRLSVTEPLRRALVDDGSGALAFAGAVVQFQLWTELPEDWASVDWAAEELRLETEPLIFSVDVVDQGGKHAEDERTVYVDFPARPGAPGDGGGGSTDPR